MVPISQTASELLAAIPGSGFNRRFCVPRNPQTNAEHYAGETGNEQSVQVRRDDGVAIHIEPQAVRGRP